MLKKMSVKELNLKSFINMQTNFPEYMDYFDIFNNKVIRNYDIIILREHIDKLDDCLAYLKTVIKEIEEVEESNVLAFTMKDYFNKILMEYVSLFLNYYIRSKANRQIKEPHSAIINGKIALSHQVTSKYNNGGDFNVDIEPLTMSDFEEEESLKETESPKFKFNSASVGKRFEFIKPTTINDPELVLAFKKIGLDSKNCLIIKNKDSYLNSIYEIQETLSKVLME